MRRHIILVTLLTSVTVLGACQRSEDKDKKKPGLSTGSGSGMVSQRPKTEQVPPPLDLKNPPADATKTSTGLIYKKLVSNPTGAAAKRNDTVIIHYTGWRQNTGETFFNTRSRQPLPLNLASTAPGFTEAMQLIKKGEKGVIWLPPSIGYKGSPPPGASPETLVYEVEVVDITPAPETPADLKQAPADAQTLKSGAKLVVVRPGTGTEKARYFDTATFNYTAWDSDGRMFDSTEMRKRPVTAPPFRQAAAMEEVLTSMTGGQRVRFWVEADKMAAGGKPLPGQPKGLLTYEVEMLQIAKGTEPWPVPADVAKPPADAKKTAKGVSYKILKAGKGGAKCQPSDSVRVNYTGWTTDGRMFDSSVIKNEPAEFNLSGVIAGWTDGFTVLSPGDKARFWIPEELAYKGAPGRPQGMLVFDVELLEIKDPAKAEQHGHSDDHGAHGGPAPEVPKDVAKPPSDAKKSPKGVSYKVLKAGKGGPKPKASDTVKVHYSGWTTDGKMFDSSVTRGQPAEFPLTGVIAGWTDAIPVMSVGDKVRFWIPEELAYKGQEGRPQGMLVFDVELLEIKPGM